MAGVGVGQLFAGDELFATADTLMDSSLTLSATTEDLRGGPANALLGIYVHSTELGVKLTDAMFNLEYLAANVGSELEKGGDVFDDRELKADGTGKITLPSKAVPMRVGGATYAYVVRSDMKATQKRKKVIVNESNEITGLDTDATYCVRYLYTNAAADRLRIYSDFIPGTYYLFLTGNLYSGDVATASQGTKIGTVTIRIPRFMLNGNQEISMTATGVANTALDGRALRGESDGCADRGLYAEVVQVVFDEHWYTDASGLIIEDNYIEMAHGEYKTGSAPVVYAWYPNAMPKMLSNAILEAQESNLATEEKSKLVYSITAGDTGLTIDESTGVIGGTPAAGTATIKVVAQNGKSESIAGMDASATIVLS